MSQRVSGYDRVSNDDYETPDWVTKTLAPFLRNYSVYRAWEPAPSSGKLVRALKSSGFHVTTTRRDFLSIHSCPDPRNDAIITNPPYGKGGKLAVRFIEHALNRARIVGMLLPVDFDSAKTRVHLFRDCKFFCHKIILLDRISWFDNPGGPGPSANHAWYMWSRYNRFPPILEYVRREPDASESRSATASPPNRRTRPRQT